MVSTKEVRCLKRRRWLDARKFLFVLASPIVLFLNIIIPSPQNSCFKEPPAPHNTSANSIKLDTFLEKFWSHETPYPSRKRGVEQGGKSPFSLLSEPISPSSLLFEPISPSSLNVNFSFSPSSLLFPHISPYSQLCLGHFSLLPILFLPPPGNSILSVGGGEGMDIYKD